MLQSITLCFEDIFSFPHFISNFHCSKLYLSWENERRVKGYVFFTKKLYFCIVICFTSSQTFCKMSIFWVKSVAVTGWSRLEPAGAVWNWLEPAGTSWSRLEPAGAGWNRLEPAGAGFSLVRIFHLLKQWAASLNLLYGIGHRKGGQVFLSAEGKWKI